MSDYVPREGDRVKLGSTAKEEHTVLGTVVGGTVQVRQNTTGKTRFVRIDRCVLTARACGAPPPYSGTSCTRPEGHEGGHGNRFRAWAATPPHVSVSTPWWAESGDPS